MTHSAAEITSFPKIVARLSQERGHMDIGWLKGFHTFPVGAQADPNHAGFGSIKVINEDRVDVHKGFDLHPHREFEIFSYIISGELAHRDSMGNFEVMKRGDVQLTSAGTGIRHAEFQHGSEPVHFLQIWAIPSTSGLTPQYFTRHVTEDEKTDRWALVVAPIGTEGVTTDRKGSGAAPIHSPVFVSAAVLSPNTRLPHTQRSTKAYVHVPQTSGYNRKGAVGASVRVTSAGGEVVIREGDGAYIHGTSGAELAVMNIGDRIAEVLMFDIDV